MGLTPIQKQFLNDWKHRYFVVPSGRRSRKTLISKRKIQRSALKFANTRYFHAAPTIRQAKSIFWKDLKEEYEDFAIDINNTDLIITLFNKSVIEVHGLDKAKRIEGTPWNGGHITEIADCKEDIVDNNILPLFLDTDGFLILDGVPEGDNFLHDLALYASGGALPFEDKPKPYYGAFAENPDDPEWCLYAWLSSDVVDEKKLASHKRKMDKHTYEKEYEVSFKSHKGKCYYAFTDKNINNCQYQKGEIVRIGMDFNHDFMTATFSHHNNDIVKQFGEAFLENSNTPEMIEYIDQYFGIKDLDPRIKKKQFIVYPDSSGKSERSNASRSDIALINRAGFGTKYHPSNPLRKDRVNAVNAKIKNANGEITFYINKKKCPMTVRDLNKMNRLPDGRDDKSQEDKGIGHISSGLGYHIAYEFPIKEKRKVTAK